MCRDTAASDSFQTFITAFILLAGAIVGIDSEYVVCCL